MASESGSLPDSILLGKFAVGALLMRSAGCVVNDLLDQDFDAKVKRTKSRPIASGAVKTREAVALLLTQLSLSFGILITFDWKSILLGSSSLILVGIYPLMKRITNYPQVVLGMTFNWGVLLGWSVVQQGVLDLPVVLPLYLSSILWTVVYDTIYAHQDKDDDQMLGLKSTALHFGERTKPILSGLAVASVAWMICAGYMGGMGLPFYLVSVGGMSLSYAWQLLTVDLKNSPDCMSKFVSNQYLAACVFAGILLDKTFLP